MTFDEWYEATYHVPFEEIVENTDAMYQYLVAREAWEAGLAQGHNDLLSWI